MKYTTKLAVALAVIIALAIAAAIFWAYKVESNKVATPVAAVVDPVDPTLVTREFTEKVLTRCQAKLSATKRAILTEQLVRVTHQRFEKEENRQAYLALLCIESGYNQGAKSPVGATGIAQLMPKYAADFAKLCGYSGIEDGDILDTEVNLNLGACFFKSLIDQTGNVYIAMAGYNGGASGTTVKNLKALKGGGPQETADYVNKIAVLKEEIINEKTNYVSTTSSNK